jgi:predicted acetyltransferase
VGDDIEIRPVDQDEFPDVLKLAGVAFGEEYSQEDADAYRTGFPFERSLAVYEDGRIVAISGVLSLELSVPGGVAIPMGGVTWIATLPTHRRRGLLTRLMAANFAGMAERGEIVSGLGASEGNIYGRFGYGPATSVASFGVERAHAASTLTRPPIDCRPCMTAYATNNPGPSAALPPCGVRTWPIRPSNGMVPLVCSM